MYPKNFDLMGFRKKTRGGGLTSEVHIYFDRGVAFIMSIPNADLIAVSLACPKIAKSPYSMNGASLQLSLS